MELLVNADFVSGKKLEQKPLPLTTLLDQLEEGRSSLLSEPVDSIISVIDRFAEHLLHKSNPIHRQCPGAGIPFIASWCRRQNIERLLDAALPSRSMLDDFNRSQTRPDRAYRAFPRGLVVHWLAGNVPTLGFLSLIGGLVTKNANVVKVANDTDDLLATLLNQMAQTTAETGMDPVCLLSATAVIRYDHTERHIGEALSRRADTRIIWGSDETVRQIRSLPTKIETNDVVFPNRTSLVVISEESLRKGDTSSIARRLAQDISVFEQKACASPHTVFLLSSDNEVLRRFAKQLQGALYKQLRRFPKNPPSEREVSTILNLRARYDMFHEAWYSGGTEFSVLSDDLVQLGPPIGNRTVFLRLIQDTQQLTELITPEVQTIGIEAHGSEFAELTSILGAQGVFRFAKLGTMTHFESPWDGHFLPQHLVRWTSRPEET